MAQNWSPEQQQIADEIKRYAESAISGSIDEQMAFLHPSLKARSFAPDQVFDYDDWRGIVQTYETTLKMQSFDLLPREILVFDNNAVAMLDFKQVLLNPEGKIITSKGPLTATMLKENGRWLYTSFSWMGKVE